MSNNIDQLKSYDFKFKKSLGQNFLFDSNITDKIVKYSLPLSNTVIEIGPGAGTLTRSILKLNVNKIILIEKDKSLIKLLENLKEKNNSIEIYNKDALSLPIWKLGSGSREVIANLPYNISTKILINLLKNSSQFSKLTMMFQKEVANRIISDFNKSTYGRLSIISNWKLNIKKIIDIKPYSFYPSPKVESSLLILEPKKNYYILENSKNLEHITNIFFNQRRKMIKRPMKIIFKNFEEMAKTLSLDLTLRPQNLSKLTYYKICSYYEKLLK